MIFADCLNGLGDLLAKKAQLDVKDTYLRSLAGKMPNLLLNSRSVNTSKKYMSYFNKFVNFMNKYDKSSLPASAVLVSLFIVHLIEHNTSYGVVCSYVYAIKWMNNLHGYTDPTLSPNVKDLVLTSRRTVHKSRCKKDTLSPVTIRSLFEKYSETDNLFVIRDLAMIITCFTGFLRYDEMSNIKCKDLSFNTTYVTIHIAKSKTDQFRDGNEVLLSKIDSPACPYSALTKYVKAFNVDLSSPNFLFRAMYSVKGKSDLRHKMKRLSYTRTRELILSRLHEVAPVGCNIGLHSLRASGVSAAASSGVEERCFKRHGRWQSNAVHGYIKESIESRLSVSQQLGL